MLDRSSGRSECEKRRRCVALRLAFAKEEALERGTGVDSEFIGSRLVGRFVK